MGEPYKFGAEQRETYLSTLRTHPIKKHAAETIGMTRQAIDYHREKDEPFAVEERMALAEGRAKLLAKVKSAEWLLSHSDPETYTDRKEIKHEGGVQITLAPHPDMMDDDPPT